MAGKIAVMGLLERHVLNRLRERGYVHNVIDNAECYADGVVHTNGLEDSWSRLRR